MPMLDWLSSYPWRS